MMTARRAFWRSVQSLIGAVIGVGIFGLPFVFAQSGYVVGLTYLSVVGVAYAIVLVAYGDIVMNTPGTHRLVGMVEMYLGRFAGWLMALALFCSAWGAMTAYTIIGGEFLHVLFGGVIPFELTAFQLLFFGVSAVLLIGGLGFVTKIEAGMVLFLLLSLAVLMGGSSPHIDVAHLTYIADEKALLMMPFGVAIFAFGGAGVLPEMAQSLGKFRHLLRPAIMTAMAMIFTVYICFTIVVVGVTGPATTAEAMVGLGSIVGNWAMIVGAIVGFVSVFTSFLILGLQVMDTMLYDYKRRFWQSWVLTVAVPLTVFLLGARSFIEVIGITGGILGGIVGLLVVATYLKAKRHVCTPKRCLSLPNAILYAVGSLFVAAIVVTIFSI